MTVKIRTLYFKVADLGGAGEFWERLLQIKPHKDCAEWKEFRCGNIRLGLLLNDAGDPFTRSGCVPVFEFEDDALQGYLERAKALGAAVILDGIDDPNLRSVVFRDPFGHEFEMSKFHD